MAPGPPAYAEHERDEENAPRPPSRRPRSLSRVPPRPSGPDRRPRRAPCARTDAPDPPEGINARWGPGAKRTQSSVGQAAPIPAAPAPMASHLLPAAQAQSLAPPVVIPAAPPCVAPRETPIQAGNRLALITLVDRIADAVDMAPLRASVTVDEAFTQAIERAAREQAAAMRDEGEAPEGIDLDALARDAVRELVGLGAIGALLDDDEITEIQCVRNDQVLAHRGSALTHADASFTSDEALGRVIARLALQSGEPVKPGELVIERRLARGAHMIAIAPPAATAHALVVRKKRKVDATLEDLVRSGALSRPMAVFLDACVQARANILASAPTGTSTAQLVAALASAAPPGERIALLSDVEEVQIAQAHVVGISLADARPRASEEAVRAAARLRSDRLILSSIPAGRPRRSSKPSTKAPRGSSPRAPRLRSGSSLLASRPSSSSRAPGWGSSRLVSASPKRSTSPSK